MQGLKVKLFLILCTTKGEEEKKRERDFFVVIIHQIEEKERIEERKYRHMCIHAFLLARCIYREACVRVYNSLAISWYL